MASCLITSISFEIWFLRVHVRPLTCWFNEMVHFVNHPSDWVALGVAVLIFVPSLWVYGFVHLIKQIQLFCHFVDTFFVWPGILFAVATPQLDLNVEQTSANLNQLLRLPATNQCDLYPWVHLVTLRQGTVFIPLSFPSSSKSPNPHKWDNKKLKHFCS